MANDRKDKTIGKGKGGQTPSMSDLIKEFRKSSNGEKTADTKKALSKQTIAIEGWVSKAEKNGSFNATTSKKISEELRKSTEAINTGNLSGAELNNEFAKLQALQKESLEFSKNPSKKYEKISAAMLGDLSKQLEKQTKIIKADTASVELGKKVQELQKTSLYQNKETSTMLADTYAEYTKQLEDAIGSNNIKNIDIAQKQLEALEASVGDEEKRREAAKANDVQTSALLGMQSSLEGVSKGLTDIGQGAVKGGGFIGGLLGMFLLFTDPEKFGEIMKDVMSTVTSIFKGIIKVFQGDMTGALEEFKGHGMAIGGILLALGAYMAGPIVGALASVMGILSKLKVAIGIAKVFMMGTLVPGIISTFTGIFGAMAPFVAIGLLVSSIVGLLMFAVKELGGFDSYGDMFAVAFAGMKDAFGYLVNFIGDIVNGIIDLVQTYGGKLADFLGFKLPDLSGYKMERSATNNLEMVNKSQAEEKKIRDDREAAGLPPLGEESVAAPAMPSFSLPPMTGGDDLINGSRTNDASNKASMSNVSQVISQTTNAPKSTSSITNIMSSPSSMASMTLAGVSSR